MFYFTLSSSSVGSCCRSNSSPLSSVSFPCSTERKLLLLLLLLPLVVLLLLVVLQHLLLLSAT